MRIRLLDISDKRPHSQAPEWVQSDCERPIPQKIARMFFIETQVSADGSQLLTYGGRHSTPEFPWHQPSGGGFNEYSDDDVAMSVRIWMLETFEWLFPITEPLIRDVMAMLAAVCVKHERDRKRARAGAQTTADDDAK